jgi:hypothetical protein
MAWPPKIAHARYDEIDKMYREQGWPQVTDEALGIPPHQVESQARDVAKWAHEKLKSERGEPVAWVFELAKYYNKDTREYSVWGEPQLSFTKPCVPEGSIRNLRALYT